MITSNQITKLSEKYLTSGTVRGQHVIVYENPTSSDFVQMNRFSKSKKFRFIANGDTKKFYVWDAYLATHDDVKSNLLHNFQND